MLTAFLIYAVLSGAVNSGVYICTVKWELWRLVPFRECAFCLMFWCSVVEFFTQFPLSLWPYLVPVSLASAAIGRRIVVDI
jgi:hypothetical protein